MMKFLLEGEVYLIDTMEVNNTTALVNIFDCIVQFLKINKLWMMTSLLGTSVNILKATH